MLFQQILLDLLKKWDGGHGVDNFGHDLLI